MRPRNKSMDNEHLIDLILLALTLVSIELFYNILVSDFWGALLLFIFIAAGVLYTAIVSISLSLRRYETANSRLKWNDRLGTIEFYLFLAISVIFWCIFVQTVVGTQTYQEEVGENDQELIHLVLILSYPLLMVVLTAFSKYIEKKIENVSLVVSPDSTIIIRGNVDSTQMLFVNIYNDSKKILYKVEIRIDFPDGVYYWMNQAKGDAKKGVFIDTLQSIGPNSSKEYRIIPVFIGDEGRSGGLIRIKVRSELESMEKIITGDLREPSTSIEDANP